MILYIRKISRESPEVYQKVLPVDLKRTNTHTPSASEAEVDTHLAQAKQKQTHT